MGEADIWAMAGQARLNPELGERNALLVLVMFYGALRCSEVLSLTLADLLPSGNLRIKGKRAPGGGKGARLREVGIPPQLYQGILNYIALYHIRGRLFPMTRVNAYYIIKALGHKIGKAVYPHLLRHSRAIDLAEKTGRETIVQRHLGHSSRQTTDIYFRFLDEMKAAQTIKDLGEKIQG